MQESGCRDGKDQTEGIRVLDTGSLKRVQGLQMEVDGMHDAGAWGKKLGRRSRQGARGGHALRCWACTYECTGGDATLETR